MLHLNSANESFLRVHKKEGDLYDKALTLIDEDLDGVDPFSDDLSEEIKDKIIEECKKNPWYFYREVIRVPNRANPEEPQRLSLSKGLFMQQEIKEHSDRTLFRSPRQSGRLLGTVIRCLHSLLFGKFTTKSKIVSFNIHLRREAQDVALKHIELLPSYLKESVYVYYSFTQGIRDKDSKSFMSGNNELEFITPDLLNEKDFDDLETEFHFDEPGYSDEAIEKLGKMSSFAKMHTTMVLPDPFTPEGRVDHDKLFAVLPDMTYFIPKDVTYNTEKGGGLMYDWVRHISYPFNK